MRGDLCQYNTYIESYGTSKFVYLTSRKGNTNGPQQGNGRNRHVTGREPSFRARSIDRKDGTHHEEQLSLNDPSTIRSSSLATGTHAGTPPLPAKKSGRGVGPVPSTVVLHLWDRTLLEPTSLTHPHGLGTTISYVNCTRRPTRSFPNALLGRKTLTRWKTRKITGQGAVVAPSDPQSSP